MRLCHLHLDLEDRSAILDLLLHHCHVDVNATDVGGRTALCHACIAEKVDVISALAEVPECDPNKVDRDGNTPLIYAVKSRKVHIVDSILNSFFKKGLNVDYTNKKGNV